MKNKKLKALKNTEIKKQSLKKIKGGGNVVKFKAGSELAGSVQ